MKIITTITFYLPQEEATELDRLSKYRRQSPQQWCKARCMTILRNSINKGVKPVDLHSGASHKVSGSINK